jgi:hypothetical protein
VADRPDRQRLQPTVDGRIRLLATIEAAGQPHVVDPGALGEYAELIAARGRAEADALLPDVAAHLAAGCPGCDGDLRELVALATEPDELAPTRPQAADPKDFLEARLRPSQPPLRREEGEEISLSQGERAEVRGVPPDDSGIHAVDLPDPRAAEAEAAARRQRLRRIRDLLLVAAAAAILLIGLSLVGLAYLASGQREPVRITLTPVPATAPTAATAPGQPPTGRTAPSGAACPASHPLKGNRESMIYHSPGGEFYNQTRPEDCFATPADAEASGYRASQR